MRKINTDLMKQFSQFLTARGIAKNEHYHYQKWLRYYLDFGNYMGNYMVPTLKIEAKRLL